MEYGSSQIDLSVRGQLNKVRGVKLSGATSRSADCVLPLDQHNCCDHTAP